MGEDNTSTNIPVKAEQAATAKIIPKVSVAPTFVTTGRCLVEELHTPLKTAGSTEPTEIVTTVAYQYGKEGVPTSARLVESLSVNPIYSQGRVYTKEQLEAHIASLQVVVARLQ